MTDHPAHDVNARAAAECAALGNLLKLRRRQMGIRQADLALASGVSRQFIVDIEKGKVTVEMGRVLLVARALRIPLIPLLSDASPAPESLTDDLPDMEEEPHDLAAPSIF